MNIFIFGDSNSWGYLEDGKGIRYHNRWPIVMLENLNQKFPSITLSEDNLPGRTTNLDDPKDGSHLSGLRSLKASLLSQSPILHSIIMLGTNDLKKRFDRNANEIARALEILGNIVKQSKAGIGTWNEEVSPSLSIISPPILGDLVNNLNWNNSDSLKHDEWIGAFEKSKKLDQEIMRICKKNNFHFINSNKFIKSSNIDPIHWSRKSHHIFGKAISDILVKEIL